MILEKWLDHYTTLKKIKNNTIPGSKILDATVGSANASIIQIQNTLIAALEKRFPTPNTCDRQTIIKAYFKTYDNTN